MVSIINAAVTDQGTRNLWVYFLIPGLLVVGMGLLVFDRVRRSKRQGKPKREYPIPGALVVLFVIAVLGIVISMIRLANL